MNKQELAVAAAKAAQDKNAQDVVALDMTEISTEADYFVIATVQVNTQMRAVVEAVMNAMEGAGAKLKQREGLDDNPWVLLDYYDVVIHIFLDQERAFYSLDKLWAPAKKLALDEEG